MAQEYDLIVIGGGPAGYVAAIRASQLGLRTALVEKRTTLGGTCLNVGCIPSKALLDSSEFYARAAHEGKNHGISIEGLAVDLQTMHQRKHGIVKKLTGGVAMLMKANGIDVHTGTGTVQSANTVVVTPEKSGDATTLTARNILLATGSVPIELPFLPVDGKTVVDSTGALEFENIPEHLVIVGGGVIGLELGSVWARLGAKVTVIEVLPEIMAGWDGQVAKTMRRELGKQGVSFMLETRVTGLKKKGATPVLLGEAKDGSPIELSCDKVLVAVGRRPFTEGSGIAELGLEMDQRRIRVNEHYQTSVSGVWAIGDIIHGPMLAHKAEDEGIAAAECIAGKSGHVNYNAVPNVIYTWPEAAAVGPTEEELKAQGRPYKSGTFPFAANGRALAMDAPGGFVKILADVETDAVIAAHMVGPWVSDLIGEIVAVMEFGGSSEDIARSTHAHPTLAEVVKEAALAVDGRMIHAKN